MSLDKAQAEEKMRSMGYDAKLQDGVLQITIKMTPEDLDKRSVEISGILKDIGYAASWGLKCSQPGSTNARSLQIEAESNEAEEDNEGDGPMSLNSSSEPIYEQMSLF